MKSVSVSIVSHGQINLILNLLQDLKMCKDIVAEVLLTLNLDEPFPSEFNSLPFPVIVIKNRYPKGFGANHNQAFSQSSGAFFCVMNPDIRFEQCPMSALKNCLDETRAGVVAPVVMNALGEPDDSARKFPTPGKIFRKLLSSPVRPDYKINAGPYQVDWLAGMFLLFPRHVFQQLNGFDEGYFLYYEDVDLCARAKLEGLTVMVCGDVRVVHHAQRTSHRQLRYMNWHLRSMVRFFLSPVYRQLNRFVD